MKLQSISVENFRALSMLNLSNLSDAVVLAGPNGCGKSCVLDAIRLLKSAYGSYQQDEWQQWFSEFQIGLKGESAQLGALFHDESKQISLSATFVLSEDERMFLKESSKDLLVKLVWRENLPQGPMMGIGGGEFAQSANQRANRQRVESRVEKDLPGLLSALDAIELVASVTISPNGHVSRTDNLLLELIFSIYEPQKLGVIDYHGPHRNYNREQLGSVNLTIDSDNRSKQHALYNYSNKYNNVKTEMASTYVRHLLAKQADETLTDDDSLTETLKELFSTFFSGKEFLGPQPTKDGKLLFPIRLANGREHDIDNLSSGEKEVLYGYLRLYNSRPKNSIIIIDEPELHLNPRLVSGLASFYYRNLGQKLGNQLWLVTHSDTLIREAVARKEFSVYHIHPIGTSTVGQASKVEGTQEVERLVIELVGDLAAYRPGAKIVIFESTGDAVFDKRLTCSLFPDLEQRINAISGGNKKRVGDLYDVLEEARKDGCLPGQFFAITDADDETAIPAPATRLQWDVYHIENYLLEPRFILKALREIGVNAFPDQDAVKDALQACARETVPQLIQHKIRVHANTVLVSSINLGCNPERQDAAIAIAEAAERSGQRVSDRIREQLRPEMLLKLEEKLRAEYATDLAGDQWMSRFRGREILRRFVGKFATGIPYEMFREVIISRMRDEVFQPPGMKKIVDTILEA